MPKKYQPIKDKILVELWVNGIKKVSLDAYNEQQIIDKCAALREKAIREGFLNWAVYIVQKVKSRSNTNRGITPDQRKKWVKTLKKIYGK